MICFFGSTIFGFFPKTMTNIKDNLKIENNTIERRHTISNEGEKVFYIEGVWLADKVSA